MEHTDHRGTEARRAGARTFQSAATVEFPSGLIRGEAPVGSWMAADWKVRAPAPHAQFSQGAPCPGGKAGINGGIRNTPFWSLKRALLQGHSAG